MTNVIRKTAFTAYNTVARAVRRYDLAPWEHAPETGLPVYGVYHVFCDKGWRTLVADQIGHLKASGLYDATLRFYVSCIVKDEAEAGCSIKLNPMAKPFSFLKTRRYFRSAEKVRGMV